MLSDCAHAILGGKPDLAISHLLDAGCPTDGLLRHACAVGLAPVVLALVARGVADSPSAAGAEREWDGVYGGVPPAHLEERQRIGALELAARGGHVAIMDSLLRAGHDADGDAKCRALACLLGHTLAAIVRARDQSSARVSFTMPERELYLSVVGRLAQQQPTAVSDEGSDQGSDRNSEEGKGNGEDKGAGGEGGGGEATNEANDSSKGGAGRIANPEFFETFTHGFTTALHVAIEIGSPDIVSAVLGPAVQGKRDSKRGGTGSNGGSHGGSDGSNGSRAVASGSPFRTRSVLGSNALRGTSMARPSLAFVAAAPGEVVCQLATEPTTGTRMPALRLALHR